MTPLHTALLTGALGLGLGLTAAGIGVPAHADGSSATGAQGQTLTVTKADGVKPEGETVTVTGRGYDVRKGIYIAFCRDNGPGKAPSPCGGGADTTGSTGGSHWISANPPPYGKSLAKPYGPGGSFRVTLRVTAALSDTVDCTKVRCVVATRADHTRTSDRTQDVRIPIAFAADDDGFPVALTATGAAVVLAALTVVVLRRRRSGAS
ncbi:MAG TPA: hypothetical protein VHJ17_01140 [Thermomonospora sp.]|nr:hypothetical protein [Thermomonospora sp.]